MVTTEWTQLQINQNFIDFLECDAECYDYDFPEDFKYSEREDFNYKSTEKWATEEILERIRNGENAEDAIWEFCGDMVRYTSMAKSQEMKDHFNTAYYVGYYLIEMYDDIAYGDEEEE